MNMYKILLLGDSGVGKTQLLQRYTTKEFDPHGAPTIAFDILNVELQVDADGTLLSPVSSSSALGGTSFETALAEDGKKTAARRGSTSLQPGDSVKVQLWDTAGQERFHAFSNMVFRGAHGALVVYDVTRYETFHSVRKWIEKLKQQCALPGGQSPSVMLVGNKADLVHIRSVPTDEGAKLAKELGVLFVETSALLNTNVEKCFRHLVTNVHAKVTAPSKKRKAKKDGAGGPKPTKKGKGSTAKKPQVDADEDEDDDDEDSDSAPEPTDSKSSRPPKGVDLKPKSNENEPPPKKPCRC
jgi:small GTP-binding protein